MHEIKKKGFKASIQTSNYLSQIGSKISSLNIVLPPKSTLMI